MKGRKKCYEASDLAATFSITVSLKRLLVGGIRLFEKSEGSHKETIETFKLGFPLMVGISYIVPFMGVALMIPFS